MIFQLDRAIEKFSSLTKASIVDSARLGIKIDGTHKLNAVLRFKFTLFGVI